MTVVPSSRVILFVSPTIVSGEENAVPYVADVLVENGIIKSIGKDLQSSNARRVEAQGYVLSPGFIDMHAHSDLYLLSDPVHEPKISQGCTVSPPTAPRFYE